MIDHLAFAALVLLAGTHFALLEIQIEGAEGGWAWNLPTWRKDSRLARLLLGGRTLTGYHLYVHLFVLVMAHSAYGLGLPFSWAAEARIAAFLILFWVVEDFLWFVINPAFGLRRFRPEHIPWHRRGWWGSCPGSTGSGSRWGPLPPGRLSPFPSRYRCTTPPSYGPAILGSGGDDE